MAYKQKPNSGTLFKNERKTATNHPDYTGNWKDGKGNEWNLAAWVKNGKKGKFLSLSATEKKEGPGAYKPEPMIIDDDLPF
jgi:hypothetical protein